MANIWGWIVMPLNPLNQFQNLFLIKSKHLRLEEHCHKRVQRSQVIFISQYNWYTSVDRHFFFSFWSGNHYEQLAHISLQNIQRKCNSLAVIIHLKLMGKCIFSELHFSLNVIIQSRCVTKFLEIWISRKNNFCEPEYRFCM